jgi:hypothetical protein
MKVYFGLLGIGKNVHMTKKGFIKIENFKFEKSVHTVNM